MGKAPSLKVATNDDGSSVFVQVTAPTNPTYSNTVLFWRPWDDSKLDEVSTNNVVSGSFEITSLTERTAYEIWGTPVLSGGNIQGIRSNNLVVVPTSGSIREKITNRLETLIEGAFDQESDDLIPFQIQTGSEQFRGKFRGKFGVCLIDCSRLTPERYTNVANRVTYQVDIHFAWKDMRREDVVEPNIGDVAEYLRLLLDEGQDTTIPNLIKSEVLDIPFNTDVFDIGENLRGFALQVNFDVEECITSL